jgi:hypothetical protein
MINHVRIVQHEKRMGEQDLGLESSIKVHRNENAEKKEKKIFFGHSGI